MTVFFSYFFRKSRAPETGDIRESDEENFMSENDSLPDLPMNDMPSVGPLPSDRRFSTSTQG